MCDLLQKIELIHAAGTQFTPPYAHEVAKTLYEILTILDGKDWRSWRLTASSSPPPHSPRKKPTSFTSKDWRDGWQPRLLSYRWPLPHCVSALPKFPTASFTMSSAPALQHWTTPTRSITSRLWSIGGRPIIKLPGGVRLSRFHCFLSCFGCRCTCEIGATPRVNERDRRLG